MKNWLMLAIVAACALPGVAQADAALAQDKQCMGCHALKQDGAGPSFEMIARKWRGRKDAEATMVATIRKGSEGTGGPHWNKATMPDQAERPTISVPEARQLARWILTL